MRRTVVTLARGVYEDRHGRRVKVTRRGQTEDRRFPPSTPLDVLIAARRDIEDRLAAGPPTRTGTLAGDIATALQTIASPKARQTAAALLAHWSAAETTLDGRPARLGELHRAAITPLQVRTVLATFAGRFKPKTVKELRRLLAWIWTTLDGPDSRNPVRAVKGPRVRYDDPRGIDYDVIGRILAALPDRGRPQDARRADDQTDLRQPSKRGRTARPAVSLTKIRLTVMAYTGLHQIELARLEPRDIDLPGRRLWIHPRVKGTGTAGAWHPLTAPAVAALQAFVDADAFGPFSVRSMARSWRLALRKAEATWKTETREPWPVRADARPYDLRHSFGTAVWLATGDIRAAQAMLRHRQGSTTERYTRAGVSRQVAAAVAALDAALPRAVPRTPRKVSRNGR